jgi:hypothetical protein
VRVGVRGEGRCVGERVCVWGEGLRVRFQVLSNLRNLLVLTRVLYQLRADRGSGA